MSQNFDVKVGRWRWGWVNDAENVPLLLSECCCVDQCQYIIPHSQLIQLLFEWIRICLTTETANREWPEREKFFVDFSRIRDQSTFSECCTRSPDLIFYSTVSRSLQWGLYSGLSHPCMHVLFVLFFATQSFIDFHRILFDSVSPFLLLIAVN